MARVRKPLTMAREKNGNVYVTYFWHPVEKKIWRIPLDPAPGIAGKMLEHLNAIFLNPENWLSPPAETPPALRRAWLGPKCLVKMKAGEMPPEEEAVESEVFRLKMEVDFWKAECERLQTELRTANKELEKHRKKKFAPGPSKTLEDAATEWKKNFVGKDSDHTKIVGYDLDRFVTHFKPGTVLDQMEGREKEIDVWLRGLMTKARKASEGKPERPARPISAGRRAQIRRHVLRFLEDSGVMLERKAVKTVKRKEIRAGRGSIRWLERSQAEKVAEYLAQPWRDLFRVQVALGLRPDELITLKREDFSEKHDMVTLSPLEHLTLKQGSRTIKVPEVIRPVIKRRLESAAVLFPDPATGVPWTNPKYYNRAYLAALKAAGAAAGVPFKMDCRIGRRTCATLLLDAGVSVKHVADILGDDPATIIEHYGAKIQDRLDPSAAALAAGE